MGFNNDHKIVKVLCSLLILLIIRTAFAGNPCEKCDIEKVKIVNDHLDSLTINMISDFLCTFDSSCINNVEFSEWSNETLYIVLEKSPGLFFEAVSKGTMNNKKILKEIENPIHDSIDIQKIYDTIKSAPTQKDVKNKYMDALILAASKQGQIVKK